MLSDLYLFNSLYKKFEVVDLSPMLERGIPRWPTHPHLVIDQTVYFAKDGYYCQTLNMGEHVGCHVDAPYHVVENMPEKTVEKVKPDVLMGRAVVYDFSDMDLKPGDQLRAEEFLRLEEKNGVRVGKGEIALINFGWMKKYWKLDVEGFYYATNSPGLDESAVKLLYDRGIKAVGCDNVACDQAVVDGVSKYAPGHLKYWLPNDILIMEMMSNLEQLPAECFVIAIPLKIKNGSGSPIRPIALVERQKKEGAADE